MTASYHSPELTATLGDPAWWLRPVTEPEGAKDERLICLLLNALRDLLAETSGALRHAILHTLNSIARLALNRKRSMVQVARAYVMRGAGVGVHTATKALDLVCRALSCVRTAHGYLTTTYEAIAACIRLVDEVGAPCPEVHRDDWGDPQGKRVVIPLPNANGKDRGVTHCPCGEHSNGDAHPSMVYDKIRRLCTCLVSRAVYRLLDAVGTAVQVRAPYANEDRAGGADHRPDSDRDHNTYGQGGGSAPGPGWLPPDEPWPWERPAWWVGPWSPWGQHEAINLRHRPTDPGSPATTLARRTSALSSAFCDADPHAFTRAMIAADRCFGSAREEDLARTCEAYGLPYVDRLESLEAKVLDADATVWGGGHDGRPMYPKIPAYRPVGTDMLLIDIDDQIEHSTDPDPERCKQVREALEGEPVALVTITATSTTGTQVVLRVPGWCPDPARLYADPRVRAMLERIGAKVRDALGYGGIVDPAVWAPGRCARRPGWRTDKQGRAVRARLWWDELRGDAR